MMGHELARQPETPDQEEIRWAASQWHAATTQKDMDWDGFTRWLRADPRHRAAYEEVALADAALDDHRDFLRAAPYDMALYGRLVARSGRWTRWAGLGLAASLVAALAVPRFLQAPETVYHTGASAEHVALHDGSSIELGPHSSLTVSDSKEDKLVLTGGAWFDIPHDPARRLLIEAGGVEITDIGTRFDVQADGRQVRVAVAQGTVEVAAPALDTPIRLDHGREVMFDGQGGTAIVRDVPPETVGLWRSGRLTYQDIPLSLVAADIRRYAGVKVEVASSLRDREFSGTFVIGNGETALRDLSQLMGLELARSRSGYRLVERHR
jgi:transmembrane sensor